MTTGALLATSGIDVAFGGVQALSKVSIEVARGSITSLIGPNGAGKTTLFNVVSGFYRPLAGRVVFGGTDITAMPSHQRAAAGLARTFQNISLFRGMSVLDNIKLGAHTRLASGVFSAGCYVGRAQREEIALREELERDVIEFLEIDHIRKVEVSMLPYGLQKRVELARALAMKPELLLLDEPVAGMNREETEDTARFILDIKEHWGATVLMVDHDMGVIMDISDQVWVLNFGEVIATGMPAQVQAESAVIEAYLGSDGARQTAA